MGRIEIENWVLVRYLLFLAVVLAGDEEMKWGVAGGGGVIGALDSGGCTEQSIEQEYRAHRDR